MKPLLLTLALTGGAASVLAAPAPVSNPATQPVAASKAPAGVAADVNGEKIPLTELTRRVEAKKADQPALATGTPAATKALAELRDQMLDDLITIRLLSQEARRRKIVTAPAKVDDSIKQLKAQFKDDSEFTKWLALSGVNQTDVRARLADELAMDELTAQVTSDVTVSDADIATFYRAHPEDFTIPAAVKARHILLAVNPNASPADKEAVRKRALALIKQLKGGADFAALAKNNSDDQSNKDTGGDLGAFERGMMVPAFEKAAFDAKKGDLVGPVETNFGFHIVKIDDVFPEKIVDLKDVKDDKRLRFLILRQKKQERFDAFVAGLRASAKINKYG